MKTVTYFLSAPTSLEVEHLIFEQNHYAAFNELREGEISLLINQYLDIDLKVKGDANTAFSLFVQVENKYIGSPSVHGEIRGVTDKNGDARIINAYLWK